MALEAAGGVVLIRIDDMPGIVQDMLVARLPVYGARLPVSLPTTYRFEAADGSVIIDRSSNARRKRLVLCRRGVVSELRQSTAVIVTVGPVIDGSGNFVTNAQTADFKISKAGVISTLSGASVSHESNGVYNISLTTNNVNTVGLFDIFMGNPSMSMSVHSYRILSPESFDVKNQDLPSTLDQIWGSAASAESSSAEANAKLDTKPSLGAIEDSTVLAKQLTSEAIQASILNLTDRSAKINIWAAPLMEIPDTGSTAYAFTIVIKDDEDKLVNLDATPTVIATNAAEVNRSANLSAVTNPSTGVYKFTYTVASTHPPESLRISVSGAVLSEARYSEWIGSVVDYNSITLLQQIYVDLSGKPTLAQMESSTLAKEASVLTVPATTRDLVYSAMPDGPWPDGSFGDRLLISNNNNRSVGVTGLGSGHVQCVVHEILDNAVTGLSLDATAVVKLQNGLALQSTLLVVDKSTSLIPALL
jgi:hypothetical protein